MYTKKLVVSLSEEDHAYLETVSKNDTRSISDSVRRLISQARARSNSTLDSAQVVHVPAGETSNSTPVAGRALRGPMRPNSLFSGLDQAKVSDKPGD